MDLNEIFNEGERSKKTIHHYKGLIKRLYTRVTGNDGSPPDLDWLEDIEAVKSQVMTMKPATKKLYTVPLMIVLRKLRKNDLFVEYQKLFQSFGKELRESKKDQTKTENETKNWVSMEEVNARIKELEADISRAKKEGLPLERDARKAVIMHLCLCLYTKMPPLRNDYSNLKIMKPPYSIEPGKNVLYDKSGSYTLHLSKYKTSRAYGKQTIAMPECLNKTISESLKLFPRSFLLSKIDHPREPMSRNYLSVFMSKIFPGKKVGSSLFRKLYITEKFGGDHSLQERDDLAKQMLHSRHVAQTIYEKHH